MFSLSPGTFPLPSLLYYPPSLLRRFFSSVSFLALFFLFLSTSTFAVILSFQRSFLKRMSFVLLCSLLACSFLPISPKLLTCAPRSSESPISLLPSPIQRQYLPLNSPMLLYILPNALNLQHLAPDPVRLQHLLLNPLKLKHILLILRKRQHMLPNPLIKTRKFPLQSSKTLTYAL